MILSPLRQRWRLLFKFKKVVVLEVPPAYNVMFLMLPKEVVVISLANPFPCQTFQNPVHKKSHVIVSPIFLIVDGVDGA